MDSMIEKIIENTKKTFPKLYINERNELILEPKNNLYFRLDDVKNEIDFKCKLISWLSRPSCMELTKYWQKKILKSVNELLGTNFSKKEMSFIYFYLGNDVNKKLSVEFIESGYDLKLLKKMGIAENIFVKFNYYLEVNFNPSVIQTDYSQLIQDKMECFYTIPTCKSVKIHRVHKHHYKEHSRIVDVDIFTKGDRLDNQVEILKTINKEKMKSALINVAFSYDGLNFFKE